MLQGIASNCDNPWPRGAIVAMDPTTGRRTSTYFVPEDRVGGGVWTSPAIDTEHGSIFVTTGSAHAWEDGDSFSIVRLNLDTFAIEDRWKLPNDSGDYWDGDWGSSPTLFVDADGRRLVGAGQKDGGYYAFDRNNLASGPVWIAPIAIRGDVPQNGEGTLSTAAFDGKRLYVGGGMPRDNTDTAVFGAVSASIRARAKSFGGTRSPGRSSRRSRSRTASCSPSEERPWSRSTRRPAMSFGRSKWMPLASAASPSPAVAPMSATCPERSTRSEFAPNKFPTLPKPGSDPDCRPTPRLRQWQARSYAAGKAF